MSFVINVAYSRTWTTGDLRNVYNRAGWSTDLPLKFRNKNKTVTCFIIDEWINRFAIIRIKLYSTKCRPCIKFAFVIWCVGSQHSIIGILGYRKIGLSKNWAIENIELSEYWAFWKQKTPFSLFPPVTYLQFICSYYNII